MYQKAPVAYSEAVGGWRLAVSLEAMATGSRWIALQRLPPAARVLFIGNPDIPNELTPTAHQFIVAHILSPSGRRPAAHDQLICTDLLPFQAATFDAFVFVEALDRVEQADRLISEASRVLRPEGLLLAGGADPDKRAPSAWLRLFDASYFEIEHRFGADGRPEFVGIRRPVRAAVRSRFQSRLLQSPRMDHPVFAAIREGCASAIDRRALFHFASALDEQLALSLEITPQGLPGSGSWTIRWDDRVVHSSSFDGRRPMRRLKLRALPFGPGDHHLQVCVDAKGTFAIEKIFWRTSTPRWWQRRYATHAPDSDHPA